MKTAQAIFVAGILLLLLLEAHGKKSCVKDCKACGKECSKTYKSSYECSISVPRNKNNFCFCKDYGKLPICKSGSASLHGKVGLTWITSVASLMLLGLTSSFIY